MKAHGNQFPQWQINQENRSKNITLLLKSYICCIHLKDCKKMGKLINKNISLSLYLISVVPQAVVLFIKVFIVPGEHDCRTTELKAPLHCRLSPT